MKTTFKCLFIAAFIVFFFAVNLANAAPVGKITRLEGRVDVLKPGQATVSAVSLGDGVDVGNIYRAKTNSRAEITFFNNNILRIAPATRVQVSQYSDDGTRSNQIMKLDRGKVEAISSKEFVKKVSSFAEGNKFEVHTPNAVAGIRGSGMTVGFAQMITGLFFSTGRGYFYNPSQPAQIVNVSAGFVSFIVGTGGLPSRPAPGNVSYVGGSGGTPAPTGIQSTSSTGTNLIQTNLINPINQTFTYTPPPVIPNVVVGTVPYLSGGFTSTNNEFGFMTAINNVKFYGPSATAQPTTWIADSVTGNFWNFDGGGKSFTFKVSDGGTVSAYATVTGSDTDHTGTWVASISNGNATQGVGGYTQPFTFSGTASGTWAGTNGTGTLTGNASGVVPSALTSSPVITNAVQVGTTMSMSSMSGPPYYDSITASNIKFWGTSASSAPYAWTSTVSGSRYVGSTQTIYNMSGANSSTATFQLTSTGVGSWSGNVYNGNVPAGKLGPSPAYQGAVGFDGRAAGTYTTSGSYNVITGTASGGAVPK